MCICGSGVSGRSCPGENRVTKQETSTMTPEFVIYGIAAASAVLDLICNICKLAQWLIKKR